MTLQGTDSGVGLIPTLKPPVVPTPGGHTDLSQCPKFPTKNIVPLLLSVSEFIWASDKVSCPQSGHGMGWKLGIPSFSSKSDRYEFLQVHQPLVLFDLDGNSSNWKFTARCPSYQKFPTSVCTRGIWWALADPESAPISCAPLLYPGHLLPFFLSCTCSWGILSARTTS